MKVLTIKQPYASLIKEGLKKYEFRSWKTNYRGEIYIHAGQGEDKKELERLKNLKLDYPHGEIIAKARIVDCILVDEKLKKELIKENKEIYKHTIESSNTKIYAFKLSDIEKIKPIKTKGKLSFWEYKK